MYIKASITVEASLVFPMFIYFLLGVSLIMDIINTQRKMQSTLESINKDMAKYEYVLRYCSDDIKEYIDSDIENFLTTSFNIANSVYIKNKILNNVNSNKVKDIDVDIKKEKDDIILDVKYKYSFKMPFLPIKDINKNVYSIRRAYVGIDKKNLDVDNDDTEDEYVYIGKNSTKYHKSDRCHYLYNDIKTISSSELKNTRNKNGVKYKACHRCVPNNIKSSIYYIMSSGTVYHITQNCSAIIAYSKKVKKSEVSYMGQCSYCY